MRQDSFYIVVEPYEGVEVVLPLRSWLKIHSLGRLIKIAQLAAALARFAPAIANIARGVAARAVPYLQRFATGYLLGGVGGGAAGRPTQQQTAVVQQMQQQVTQGMVNAANAAIQQVLNALLPQIRNLFPRVLREVIERLFPMFPPDFREQLARGLEATLLPQLFQAFQAGATPAPIAKKLTPLEEKIAEALAEEILRSIFIEPQRVRIVRKGGKRCR